MHESAGIGRFDAWEAIREAWTLLKGARRTFLCMTLTVAVITWFVGSVLLGWVLPPAETGMVTQSNGEVSPLVPDTGPSIGVTPGLLPFPSGTATAYPWIRQLANVAISALFAGAFAAYSLRRAVGLEVRYSMLGDYFRFFPTFLVLELLAFGAVFVIAELSTTALFIATLVGGVAFAFVHPYVVDRNAGIGQALLGSYRIVRANLGQTLLLLLIGAALAFFLFAPVGLVTLFLPATVAVVLGVVTGLVSILLTALLSVALACAFRDAVGIRTAGGEMRMGSGNPGAAPTARF